MYAFLGKRAGQPLSELRALELDDLLMLLEVTLELFDGSDLEEVIDG